MPRTIEPDGRPVSRQRGAVAMLLACLGGVCVLGGLTYYLFSAPAGTGGSMVQVRITPGSDLRQIARSLADTGAISNPRFFRLAARLGGFDRRLRPGEYLIDPGQSLPSLLRALSEGRGLTATVTIPEGWRLEQIADRVAAAGICGREALLAAARDRALLKELSIPGPSAEGFLFPETYALAQPSEPVEVIRAMHRQFLKVWSELTAGIPAPKPSLLETVTLASIVERETNAAAERPLVAAVFLNRLRIGMPLQADPTVIYGLESFDGDLRRSDLSTATPYNTYVIRGLPPGPIASPGREALAAVLAPAPVDFLFFVSRRDGTHEFSRTLGEHNRAVQRFQLTGTRRPG